VTTESTTINLAELVSDLRLMKDKVAALEKTNAALASVLTRTVEQVVAAASKKLDRELDEFAALVADRVKSIGDAIDARFGERMATIEADVARLKTVKESVLGIAADTQRSAEAAAKSAEEVKLFSAKLDLLDDRLKRTNENVEALKQAKPKPQEPAKINRR
jgi:hypothetical protein